MDLGPWADFSHQVTESIEGLGQPRVVWYRGVSDVAHGLLPSLLRSPNGIDVERALFDRYRQLHERVSERRLGSWELLCEMQHYAVPTRLLDWSEVLGCAVFFAVSGIVNEDRPAAMYVLDPVGLNNAAVQKEEIVRVHHDEHYDFEKLFFEGKPFRPNSPFSIEPPYSTGRLLAQRGKFTVHGTDPRPLEKQFSNHVRKIEMNYPIIQSAQAYLQQSGIDFLSQFPDMVGVAPFLKGVVGLKAAGSTGY